MITLRWFNAWLIRCVLLIVFGMIFVQVFSHAFAADARARCPDHFVDSRAPIFVSAALNTRTRDVCSYSAAVRFSGTMSAPLFVAERLLVTEAGVSGESAILSTLFAKAAEGSQREWAMVETVARSLAILDGELYVVSGPLFSDDGKVSALFKAVYRPGKSWSVVYVVNAQPAPTLVLFTLEDFLMRYGVDAFPSLPVHVREGRSDRVHAKK